MSEQEHASAPGEAVEPAEPAAVDEAAATEPSVDLAAFERDLADVETALERLDAGTYWTDEVTGEPLDDDLLARDPVARRAP